MENEGRIFSRDQIINEVFGYDFDGYNRNIDTHISNLRKKIERTSSSSWHRHRRHRRRRRRHRRREILGS